MDFDAVVLAGGGGTRLGGADKAGIEVGGVSLLDRVLTASSGARHTVVVGAPRPAARAVEWTLEHPPGGGPLAGLAAGVAALDQATAPAPVLVLATDLAQLTTDDVDRLVAALAAAGPEADGAMFVDDQHRAQPLAAVYHRVPLAAAIDDEQPVAHRPVRALLSRLTIITVPDQGAAADIDTAEQLAVARAISQGAVDEARAQVSARGVSGMSDEVLSQWVATVCDAASIDRTAIDISGVLDLAKDAAHGIARPAAPLTTFMAGYLAGRASAGLSVDSQSDPAGITAAALTQVGALVPAPPSLD